MKKLAFYLICIFFLNSYSQSINLESFATGLSSPVSLKHAGDNRLFAVERAGIIKIINDDGAVETIPFLDINARVINNGGEQGLLALAFHPDYTSNGYFYVNYIDNSGDTVISRFTRNTVSTADPNSEQVLLNISQPFSNHNGGDLAFGPNGYLHISTGDGGSAGDPGDRAQNLTLLLGKMLRIDVDNTSNGNNYANPIDNPYFNSPNGPNDPRPEIWAYGLRNPWRFSFDRQTNDIWIADVGQGSIEEINKVRFTDININYGWRCYEGNSPYNTSGCPPMNTLTFPVAQYAHSDGIFKCSITGGYRYRGTQQTNLQGLYFFADFCSNEIGYIEESGSIYNLTFLDQYNGNGWSSFGEDVNGELYIVGLNSGTVFKIIDADLSINENQLSNIKMFPNPTNDLLTFDFSNSTLEIQTITIFSINGKSIKTISPTINSQFQHISTKNISKGFYLVEITSAIGTKETLKLIIN